MLSALLAYAGKDPISWRVSEMFPAQTNNVAIQANPNTESCTQPGVLQPQTNAQWIYLY